MYTRRRCPLHNILVSCHGMYRSLAAIYICIITFTEYEHYAGPPVCRTTMAEKLGSPEPQFMQIQSQGDVLQIPYWRLGLITGMPLTFH